MSKKIILPFPYPKFFPRKKGNKIHPIHPGTAVRIENELYEIVEHYVVEGKHIYFLEKWDEAFTIRVIVDWNKEEEKRFIKEAKKEKDKGKITWYFQIFLGFLPENYQEKLEEKIGLNPVKATYWSSIFEFIFSFSVVVLNIISIYSGIRIVPLWLSFICYITSFEGIVRLVYNISSSEPVGSFFFFFLNLKSKIRKKTVQEDFFKSTEFGLIVETYYEKLHWERWGGINFKGQNYILNEKIKKYNLFIYNFLKSEKEFPKTDIENEKKLNKRSDSSIVFAPFWGFLPPEFQKEIEKYGRYDPKKFTKISIFFNLLLSFLWFASSITKMFFLKFSIIYIFLFIFSFFLGYESIKRLLIFFGKKEISGSFLSFFIKPFYIILFK